MSPIMPTTATPRAPDDTFAVVLPVLRDVADMFSDPFLHLGGDEVPTTTTNTSFPYY